MSSQNNDQIEEMSEIIRNTWLPIVQGNTVIGETHIYSGDAFRIAENLFYSGYSKHPPGEWLWKGSRCFCSVCQKDSGVAHHYEDGTVDLYSWCPHCGSNMTWEG